MAVSVLETVKSRANGSNTAYIVVVKLLCDDYSDLPAQSGLSGYELAQGCTAHVINENKDYMIDSSGNWHVYGGDSWTNVYTKSETDTLLDDKQDELTTAQLDAVNSGITAAKLANDEAALVELVDNGAKNKLKNTAVTQTVGEVVYTVNSDRTISAYTTATTTANRTLLITTQDDNCYVNAGELITGNPNTSLDVVMQYGIGSSGNIANYMPNEEYHVIEVSGYIRYFSISIRSGVTIPQSSPLVFKPMVCTKAAWDTSQNYVPYCPSMVEMYQMILALQQSN